MAFIFGKKGNSPDKLLEKFNKNNKPAVRQTIIDDLINLKAWDQLKQLLDTEYQSRIIAEMVDAFRSDAETLFSLYDKAQIPKIKDKIVEYILDTGHEATIWALCKTDAKFKIISFVMTEYKNDAEVLRSVFEQPVKELREVVVKRLIELKAEKELQTMLDSEFKDQIMDSLIALNRDDAAKLISLFRATTVKAQQNSVIKLLVENGADNELWQLANTEFSDQIIKFFFNRYRDDADGLLGLFNNPLFGNKGAVIDRLCQLNSYDQLITINDPAYFEQINEMLISENQQNPVLLLEIFNRTASAELKNTIVHMLIELAAEAQLWSLIESDYSHVITHCLINLNQDNPEKLFILYPQTKLNEQKENIIRQLILLKAEEQLWQLLNSEFKDMILPALVEINNDNSKKLYSLFFKTQIYDIRLSIVNHLMDLDAEQLLWMLMNTEFKEMICSFLYDTYINDTEKLFMIYDKTTGELKKKILDRLITLKAESCLWKLLDTPAREKVVPALIDLESGDADKLWQLYQKTDDRDLKKAIVAYLMELQAKDQLLKLANSEFKDMILPVLLRILPQKEVFARYNSLEISLGIMHNQNLDCAAFLSQYADLLQLAFSNKLLAIYYFRRLKDREQTYLLLAHYGLGQFMELPELNYSLEAVKEFFPKVLDCIELGLIDCANLFKKVFSAAFKNRNRDLLILAYLLDRNKFRQNVQLVRDNYNIIDDLNELQSYRNQIKLKYAELLKDAEGKDDVENLVKRRDKELEKFVERALFNQLNEIDNAKVLIPQIAVPGFYKKDQKIKEGVLLDLESIPADVKILSDYAAERTIIEKELETVLLTLEDTDEIIKAKNSTDDKISRIVDLQNFSFSLDSEGEKYSGSKPFRQKMMSIFRNNTAFECRRAILDFFGAYDRLLWLKAVIIIAKSKDVHALAYCFMKENPHYSARTLLALFKYFSLKFNLDLKILKRISGLPEKDITDHKIDKVQNEMVIWDVIFVYLVILLENMHFLYFNATREDLRILKLAAGHIKNLPQNLHSLTEGLLTDISKIAEKE